MKRTGTTTPFILLAAALALSACAPLATPTPTPSPVPPTATPPPTATASPSPLPPTATLLPPTDTAIPAGATPAGTLTPIPTDAAWKTYRSFTYNYRVNYPAGWTAQVNTSIRPASGTHPEYVTLASGPGGALPNITIYALTGAAPVAGYESCQPNLVFQGLQACRVSSPGSEALVFRNGDQYFQLSLLYQDPAGVGLFDLLITSFQLTGAVTGAPTRAPTKNFSSTLYTYSVSYPAGWSVKVDTSASAGSGTNPEYVTFTPGPNGSLVNITIYALTGAAPFTGYENCTQNYMFRGYKACRISVPAGQIPATELLIFERGDAHFEIAMQRLDQGALSAFDQFLASFELH
jgi:hypothetical protein